MSTSTFSSLQLGLRGHAVESTLGYDLGSIQATLLNRATGTIMAGADPPPVAYAVGW